MLRATPGLLLAALLAACAPRATPPEPAVSAPPPTHAHAHAARPITLATLPEGAVLLDGLGDLTRPVTTSVPEAQTWFDQGLRLLYAFNHDEAARSFARGLQLDPSCAMCAWGVAYALGPNYNVPGLADRFAGAREAIVAAQQAAAGATPVERGLIEALALRHPDAEPRDPAAMQPLLVRYADAMDALAVHFPGDDDVQVLAAEARMVTNPWRLWTHDGRPAPGTEGIVERLAGVLSRNPQHPGANHYFIHAVEASPHPERALPSAERLAGLMPGAGHVVHMPAHIFQRVGRYADASASNRAAIAADRAYAARVDPPGYYPMYMGHNWGFLAYSESMLGRSGEAIEAARNAAEAIPPAMLDMMPGMDFFTAEPLLVLVRFGRWDELLREPRPDRRYHALTGLWLHARGMALAEEGRLDEAEGALAELRALIDRVPPEEQASNNPTRSVLGVGERALAARLAEARGRPEALDLWAEAVAAEDALTYAEPADWFYPLRHFQGAALLRAGRFAEAEAVYREDLRRLPENGWALYGLAQALRGQGRSAEAARVDARFAEAWADADVELVASAF